MELRGPNTASALVTDGAGLADARDRFLSGEGERDPQIRREILASWERSRDNNVDADRILAPFIRDPDLEAPLARSAAHILDALHDQLRGEAVSTILTDQAGLVLDRRSSSHQIEQSLDAVQLAPGFSYAEQFVGTNGIGTALTSRSPAFVDGREHYTGALREFACAGAPIRHPVRGKVVGVLDITTWSQAPGPMLTALASATARQIEAELVTQTGKREVALMREYMKVCQRTSSPVLALNNDVVMMNDALRLSVDPAEQQTLIGYAVDTMRADNRHTQRTVELPSGRTAQLRYTPVSADNGLAGGMFRIRLEKRPDPTACGIVLPQRRTAALPGIAGSGPAWTRCVQQGVACWTRGDWFAIEGEPGAGKATLLRALHMSRDPHRPLRSLVPPDTADFGTWLGELSADLAIADATVVLRHAEQLTDKQAAAVTDLLSAHDQEDKGAARVIAIVNAGGSSEFPPRLRSVFPRIVEVPALRHHIDDLPELVRHLLRQLSPDDQLSCSPAALAQLARLNWPGNIAQLRSVLAATARCRSTGTIELADLPPEGLSSSHRLLSPIEALERDAIVNALQANAGNPTSAAKTIGMSRATIYRKIRLYGITTAGCAG
ncbi:Fis family transcriptional regulator [Amycolatopsis sp. WAC 01416]|nr:Fis family transcriptional regulator [Amycolatopsis sp. WAC 01416]